MKNKKPDYKKIYTDLILKKFPEKLNECKSTLQKNELSALDVMMLNKYLFDKSQIKNLNGKYRSYNLLEISEILELQKKYQLNNSQLANYFQLSRNSVAKWKKIFIKCG